MVVDIYFYPEKPKEWDSLKEVERTQTLLFAGVL